MTELRRNPERGIREGAPGPSTKARTPSGVLNEGLGHGVGDSLLVTIARRLTESLRPQDFAARLGGDEFAVICEDLADDGDPGAIAERVRAAVAEPVSMAGRDLLVNASIGIAVSDVTIASGEALLRHANVAMHTVKDGGGNGTALFDEAAYAPVLARVEIGGELLEALERRDLRLVYQPIIALRDGEVLGAEALLRWNHPKRGPIPPSEFIPGAEDSGLIVQVGDWVLREACVALQRWRAACPDVPTPYVAVNLSPRQLSQPGIVESVAQTIAETGVDPADLYLEITESVLIDDVDATLRTLHSLRRLGVGIALDDFGTGYSSLSYLRRLPCDVLKIDRSFATALGKKVEDEVIYAAMLSMGAAFGMSVVAEGIGTPEQADCLRGLGGTGAQGHHLAEPMEVEDLIAFLRGRGSRPPAHIASRAS